MLSGIKESYKEGGSESTLTPCLADGVEVEKETKNTVRYAEEAEDRRPIVGTVYVDNP